ALAMTFGGRRPHQISKVLEHAQRRDGHGTSAVERHVMEEVLCPRRPRIFGPQGIAQLIAGCFHVVDAHLAYVEIRSESKRRTVAAAQGRIAGASNTGEPAALQPAAHLVRVGAGAEPDKEL